jgi:hypothetical protein
MIAGTVVTPSLVPHARVLAASFAEHHGGSRLALVVTDGGFEPGEEEPFELLTTAGLGVDERELRRRAAIYDAGTLAKSLKPLLLRRLLEQDDVAVWLDADLEIFAPLDEAAGLAAGHGVALTPHALTPRASAGVDGVFNGGFVAAGRSGRDFVDWWAERLRRDCLFDHARGLHNDQGWLTYVPCYFDHRVLRDPGLNVAYWNLDQRRLVAAGDGYEVDGGPLRFFHFSGFDPGRPSRLSVYEAPERVRPAGERAAVERLCTRYAERLAAAGHEELAGRGTRFDAAADGQAIERPERLLFRTLLLEAERTGGPEPPDPFDAAQSAAYGDLRARANAGNGPVARLARAAALRTLKRYDGPAPSL